MSYTAQSYWHNGTEGRLLWTDGNGNAILWALDADHQYLSSKVYNFGASGWSATSYFHNTSGTIRRLLWYNSAEARIWQLDANDDYVSHSVVSFADRVATSYWRDENNTLIRLLWNRISSGRIIIYTLNVNDIYVSNQSPGTYANRTAQSYWRTSTGANGRLLLSHNTDGSAAIYELTGADAIGALLYQIEFGSGWVATGYEYINWERLLVTTDDLARLWVLSDKHELMGYWTFSPTGAFGYTSTNPAWNVDPEYAIADIGVADLMVAGWHSGRLIAMIGPYVTPAVADIGVAGLMAGGIESSPARY